MLSSHDYTFRVRYQETDAQGHVHHSTYLNYFEQGRVELLRASGQSYRDLEEQGLMLVVVEANCRYLGSAQFDDELTLRTTTEHIRGTRIRHRYHVMRDDDLLVEGTTVVACINKSGKPQRLPDWLLNAPTAEPI